MVKIAVDAMGGDNAPGEIVAGAVMAAQSRDLDLSKFTKDYIDAPYNQLHCIEDHENNNRICYIKKIKAKELWDNIVHNNWLSAEPGIIFWDNQNNYSLSNKYPGFENESTNPSIH